MSLAEDVRRVRFGLFEADLQSGELWKAGQKIRLQGQPFKVLAALLERPGEVVSREELQLRVWGKDTVVGFDHSLGTAINKIREALGDSADNPRFVETLARRGYRFLAPVTILVEQPAAIVGIPALPAINAVLLSAPDVPPHPPAAPDGMETASVSAPRTAKAASHWPPSRAWLPAALAAVSITCAVSGFFLGESRSKNEPARIEQLTTNGRISPGTPAMESLPSSVTDGLRIYTPVIDEGRTVLSQVDIHTGMVQSLPMPSEIASPTLGDISPDGSKLLLRSHLSPESEQPLWIVPTGGGSALRVANVVAHDATWMPDGEDILYAAGNRLLIAHLQDGTSTPFADLPGRAFWLRWSPDGKLLRFTLTDPVDHNLNLWQINADGKRAHPILTAWAARWALKPSKECCGVWTGDSKYFVFQSTSGGETDLWKLNGADTAHPVRVTNGPLSFEAPAVSRIGHRIFFLGLDAQSELQQYDADRGGFVPERNFLATAQRITYSRDNRWVAWTDSAGRLWRARAEGSETVQLTPDSLQVFLAQWSPDGSQLALMAREPGKAWQIYTIAADGGAAKRLLPQDRNSADPSWSADGKKIVFGRLTDLMGKEEGPRGLQILDLSTGTVAGIPESQGLFSPRWSPDGRYIAALTLDQRRLMLLDTQTGVWKTVADSSAADPVWSADSSAIYIHASLASMQPIYRVSIPDGHLQQIASLKNFLGRDVADYFFCGITPENVPIVRSRTMTGNIYSIDLDGK